MSSPHSSLESPSTSNGSRDPSDGSSSPMPIVLATRKIRVKRHLKPSLCAVCANEPSTVSYFGVRICTGCRAFFRRSVKCQKTYQCLNNELCGNGPEVSNRLACKFCRFQRCTAVGMLEKKLQLHSDNTDSRSDSGFPLVRLNVFIYGNLCPLLSEFCLLRRQINYERYNTYHGKETKVAIKESANALHDWFIGMYEYDLLDNIGRRSDKLFGQLDAEDWEELLTADYSMCWVLFCQILTTLRNQGLEEGKLFLVDESFHEVCEEKCERYWDYLYENIDDPKREQIYQVLRAYMTAVVQNLVFTVCKAMNRAKLDEAESSALLLLLFTSPSSLAVLSQPTRDLLSVWKEETLRGIADHIERTGRNVDERMADIIFLMTEFQNLIILSRNAINLTLTATNNRALPQKFRTLVERSNNRRLRSRVLQRLFGDPDNIPIPSPN